jgi:hypothetical protein
MTWTNLWVGRRCAFFFVALWLGSASMAADPAQSGDRSTVSDPRLGAESGIDTGFSDAVSEKTCVPLRSIDRTDVIDDYNILFYMRGPDIYHVRLPHRCPGLRIADSFMYSTSLTVLCDLDIIRPLRNIGGGFSPGVGCGMGRFIPITKEEVALLKNRDVAIEAGRADAEVESLVVGEDDVEAAEVEETGVEERE